MKYEIKKGIEIPRIIKGGKRKSDLRIAIESMQIGDCIEGVSVTRNNLVGILNSVKKGTGFKFATRQAADEKSFSVWRIQ